MPDFAKKAALEKEVVHVLETYGKRLLAVQRTLEDAADSVTIAKQIEEIRNENDDSLQRLQENLRIAARSPDPSTDVLGSVWNTIRIKILYHSVLVQASTAAKTCARWKHRHDVLEAMERHNREIFVSRFRSVGTPAPGTQLNYATVILGFLRSSPRKSVTSNIALLSGTRKR